MHAHPLGPRTPDSGLRTFLFLLVLSVHIYGCAARRFPQPVPLPPPALPSAEQLLAALDTRRQTLTSLRGLARVVYVDPHDKGTAKQGIAVFTPDRFRMELFSPLGIAALIACDGRALAAYFPKDKTIYRGAATPLNVARFTRVMLSAREIASLLLGLPVLPPHSEKGMVGFDEENGWLRLDLPLSEGGSQALWFEQKTLQLMRWQVLSGDGTVVARVSLADYRQANGQAFPFAIQLSAPQGKQEASIFYERIELNSHLPDSLFALAPIAGVQEIDADTFQ